MIETPGDLVCDLPCVQQASCLEGGPLLWIWPLYMQVNQKSDDDDDDEGHFLTLVKSHSDFKVKCLTFGLYTQVSDSGPHGPLV